MARTRGTFVPRGDPSSLHAKAFEQEPRRRPTNLLVEEVRVVMDIVVHQLMEKLVHQQVMEKLLHHQQLL
ncbi:hypothetical protein DEO72_LG8g1380 [Vigna unguiculata]|uniref:Uncharacterized protein n=1 Tax=Vigna unguiculata TaxID=3917 RepID=A0A4D6MPJ1_VIGUN|nr:hypothetical protein DEO72_LG8g1380 [Vigna unguiculata]